MVIFHSMVMYKNYIPKITKSWCPMTSRWFFFIPEADIPIEQRGDEEVKYAEAMLFVPGWMVPWSHAHICNNM